MTERLYYNDSYLTEFEATVEECIACGDAFKLRLDRSAFYPTSGGQSFDTGWINSARVTDVNVENGDVWHTVDRFLNVGEKVSCKIDWARRWDHMQQHAADHMIAGALHRMFGGVTIGLHESDAFSTIDVAMPDGSTKLSSEDIRRVEMDVNEHIQHDVPIRCWFPTSEELEMLPLRKKPTVTEHVRVVAIGDDEMVACGGTHPSTAGQIGLVKIVSVAPARGKMRVGFVAGMRAMKDYLQCYDAAHESATMFSARVENLPSCIAALQDKLRNAEMELARVRREQLLSEVDQMLQSAEILPDGTKLIAKFVDTDAALLRELTSKLIETNGVIALMGAKTPTQAVYVFGRSQEGTADMGMLLREAAKACGGKGGGKPDFAQGGGSEDILGAACAKLKKEI